MRGIQTMKSKPNYLKRYIISSYILINALIIVAGSLTVWVFKAPPILMWVVRNLCAWSPTYLLLIGWKKFRPDEKRVDFIKRCFSGKVKPLLLLFSFALTFGLSILTVYITALIEGNPFRSYFSVGEVSLVASVLLSFTSGPTGEELGWRGFLREEFRKKYPFLQSAVYQGLVWCFWHTLLWAVDSDFTDWSASIYITANIVTVICMTIWMNIILEYHNNLLYSIFMHFGFNIVYVFASTGIAFCVVITILYLIVTPIALWIRKQAMKRNRINPSAEPGRLPHTETVGNEKE